MKKLLSLFLSILFIHTIVFKPVMGCLDENGEEIAISTDEFIAMEYGGTLETWGDFKIVRVEANASKLEAMKVNSPNGIVFMLVDYTGNDTEITLPEGIHILHGIHSPIKNDITVIHLPSSVQKIEYESLYGMKSLKKVDMKDNVTFISAYAFSGCNSLKNIELPEGLVYIGENAFSKTGLTEIVIPSTVKTVEDSFWGCKDLKKIVITSPDTVLEDWSAKSIPNTVIYAPKDSKAEKAAKAAGIPFKAFALNRSSLSLTNGKSYNLKFNSGSDAVWKSSDSKVVSVDQNGKITAKKNGAATITATLYGKKYTCKVTVGAKTYTVKRGDTLWAIAAKQLGSGYRYKEIMKLNGLKSTKIVSGQRLKLPER